MSYLQLLARSNDLLREGVRVTETVSGNRDGLLTQERQHLDTPGFGHRLEVHSHVRAATQSGVHGLYIATNIADTSTFRGCQLGHEPGS